METYTDFLPPKLQGAGKSSTIHLIERFFDPTMGQVLLDGQDIRREAVGNHRARLALVVSQLEVIGNIAHGSSNRIKHQLCCEVPYALNLGVGRATITPSILRRPPLT